MNNKAAVIVAKDADVYLPLIYALGQLECFLQSWYLKIDYNQLINIKMIYNNSVSEIFDFLCQLRVIIGSDTMSYKFNVESSTPYQFFPVTFANVIINPAKLSEF